MSNLVDRKEKKLSAIVHISHKNEFDESQIGVTRNYRKVLEERIKEKIQSIETREVEIKGTSREYLKKKRKWMGEFIKALFGIKDLLEKTGLIEIKTIYRTGKVVLNDLKNIVIKSKDYDESKIVKSGFKMDIDFFPRSEALNNKRDCYLVQLLGDALVQENYIKCHDLDSLMEFIINYCSGFIAEFSSR
jgi:hypothetical protein